VEAADPKTARKRRRILNTAFAIFTKRGFTDTSTLEIATRAKVSKRELYALVGSKQDMLIACIAERAASMLWTAAEIPKAHDRETLAAVLEAFGTRLLSEVSQPTVIAVFRLAIAEANHTPELARALQTHGREPNRAPLLNILQGACAAGLLQGDPAEMAEQFIALLWGDLMTDLLLRITQSPSPAECRRRAHHAATALLQLSST
jgi:AcrR family transcriptional regulator